MEESSFPSLEGDLFDSFNHVELMRFLTDSRKYLILNIFRLTAPFRNFHMVEGYPFFKANFGLLEKSSFAS